MARRMPLDPVTDAKIRMIILRCMAQGQDIPSTLHQAGLVLSDAVMIKLVSEAYHRLALSLEEMPISLFGQEAQRSPGDMRRAITEYIRTMARKIDGA